MKKIRKHAKKALCMALSAAMLFTSSGITVFAEESLQEEEIQQEFQSEETSTDIVPVEEEITEEVPFREETTEQVSEEEDFVEEAEESTLANKTSEDKVVDEEDINDRGTENTSAEDILMEETVSETDSDVADTEETDAAENDLKLTFSDTDIDHGEYKIGANELTWVIDKNGKLMAEGTGDFELIYSYYGGSKAPWAGKAAYITSAVINITGMTDASGMFYNCTKLTSVDLSGFDTSSVTNMENMFYFCESLRNIDLSGFDTSRVTNMHGMFYNCSGLTSLDLSSFDTSSLTYMPSMFYNCSGLTSLDLSSFDTSGLTDMGGMFYACSSLTSLDLSSFDTSRVTSMYGMFEGCSSLTSLDLSSFDTNSVTDMMGMFYDCGSLTGLDLSSFDTSRVTSMTWMFYGCNSLTSLDLSSFDTSRVTSMYSMFNGCGSLTSLDLSSFDTSRVTSMTWMFSGCSSLTSLNLSSFDTSGLTSMSGMFYDCSSLTSLDLSSFDTNRVTDMNSMFYNCSGLTSLDLSSFDTSSVTDMRWMFYGCSGLTSLDLSSLDTNRVTDMRSMFYNCSGLTSLDLSPLDTSRVTDMRWMFYGCSGLTSLDLSPLDTNRVTNMYSMFSDCSSLTSLDLSRLDTSKVTDMGWMFDDCSSLTNLDLSSFDAGNVTNMENMLNGCSVLKTIYTPRNVKVSVSLPDSSWYDISETVYTELPKELSYSVLLKKDGKPTAFTERIVAIKEKTAYYVGATIDTNDLTVRYYGSDGTVKILNAADYTVSNIDTSTLGTKTLTVTYKGMTAEIKLTVMEKVAEIVTISGISVANCTYMKKAVTYSGTASVKTRDETDVTSNVTLTYTYSGTQADGTSYAATQNAPVNAGSYKLTVAVASDNADYTGSTEYPFTIVKAPLTVTARDMGVKIGTELPNAADYQYDTAGLLEGDSLITEPTFACNIANTTAAGTYDIIVSGADAGMNYEITYKNGTLTVSETGESTTYFTVTFSLLGHGSGITNTGVKEGSLLEKPHDPQAEGYTFSGWYKDQSCTVLWDFDKDTVQSDTTIYAGWTKNTITGGDDEDDSPYEDSERIDLASTSVNGTISAIKAKVYDQNAYEPVVKVTVTETVNGGKKKITLTEGADYRVLYQDNINAGEGKVIVKGNGIYKGEIEKTFTINPKPVKKLKVLTSGIVGTATKQAASGAVYVYDGTKCLVENVDYELSDVQPVKNKTDVVQVTVKGKSNYNGEVTTKITVYESGTDLSKLITPDNVTLVPESNAKSSAKAAEEAYAYTGKAIKPAVTVTIGGTALTTKDYKVQYQNNKDAGTAYVVVTGKGAYKGKAVIPFTIKAETVASPNDFTIKAIKDMTYNGKLQKPAVKVTIQKNGKTKNLSKKDYTVVYKSNLHAGNATVTVTGKGNYAGLSATATFKINPQQIKKASLKGTQGNLVLTYSKRTLKEGTDYEKPKYGAVNKNKVPVTIKGKGDFTGEMTKTVKVQ